MMLFLYYYLNFIPAHEIGAGDIVITMSGRTPVHLYVRVSLPESILETVSRVVFILHTHVHQGV